MTQQTCLEIIKIALLAGILAGIVFIFAAVQTQNVYFSILHDATSVEVQTVYE